MNFYEQFEAEMFAASFKARLCVLGEDNCWIWAGFKNPQGYGIITIAGMKHLAHRIAYKIAFGAFEQELCILHKCDNPPCCNPRHLFKGTRADNMKDCLSKGRHMSQHVFVDKWPQQL